MRRLTMLGGLTIALSVLGLVFGPAVSSAQAAIPTMTRSEIVARAETALGLMYTWGKESWAPNTDSGAGTDCSGLVLKCWEVPRTMLYQEEDGSNATISPRFTSYDFYNCTGPWSALSSRLQLKEGDILAYNNGVAGHVVIYAGGDVWNSPIIYEAPGTGRALRRASVYLSSSYLPRRRTALLETSTVVLDNPTAKSIGGEDVGDNWTRSTSVSGHYGADYQTQEGTAGTAWARWTPRFPSSGYYDVYIRWTSGPNRASMAKATVNTPGGQRAFFIDQRYNGGMWYAIGRHYFNAGYATGIGSVTLWATGADGYVVADAVRFVPVQ